MSDIREFVIKNRLFIITGTTAVLVGAAGIALWKLHKSSEEPKGGPNVLQMEDLDSKLHVNKSRYHPIYNIFSHFVLTNKVNKSQKNCTFKLIKFQTTRRSC